MSLIKNHVSRATAVFSLVCAIISVACAVATLGMVTDSLQRNLDEAPDVAKRILRERGHFKADVHVHGGIFSGYSCSAALKDLNVVGEGRTPWKACVNMAYTVPLVIA